MCIESWWFHSPHALLCAAYCFVKVIKALWFTWRLLNVQRPLSSGTLRLKSADPFSGPLMDPKYVVTKLLSPTIPDTFVVILMPRKTSSASYAESSLSQRSRKRNLLREISTLNIAIVFWTLSWIKNLMRSWQNWWGNEQRRYITLHALVAWRLLKIKGLSTRNCASMESAAFGFVMLRFSPRSSRDIRCVFANDAYIPCGSTFIARVAHA